MSETINITVIDQDEPISITSTEASPIYVNFYEIAVPDPRVSTARTEAIAAQAAAEVAQEAAETAQAAAETALAGIGPVVSAEVTAQLATKTTSDISEGSNLYYTDARFDTRLAAKSTTNLTEGTNLYYTDARFDTRLALKTTDNLTQGSTNKYYASSLFNTDFASKTTANLTENTNLYYTQARFDTAFAAKTTANLTENTNLYFTTARAKTAAVVNSTSGSETDQAASVASMKTYVLANVTAPADGSITKAKLATGAKDLTAVSKTAAYTAVNTDELILCSASSAAFTVTLPTAASISGRVMRIKKTDSSANKVTVDGNSTETIDGALTFDLWLQNQTITICSDGTNWFII